jgi:hypothetical protein
MQMGCRSAYPMSPRQHPYQRCGTNSDRLALSNSYLRTVKRTLRHWVRLNSCVALPAARPVSMCGASAKEMDRSLACVAQICDVSHLTAIPQASSQGDVPGANACLQHAFEHTTLWVAAAWFEKTGRTHHRSVLCGAKRCAFSNVQQR